MKFWKLSGAGNDFVLLTGGGLTGARLKKLARSLCERKLSVGADGLLYVNRTGSGAVSVRYFNPDGSEAFCGNGSRCAALWASRRGLVSGSFTLRTIAGDLEARVLSRGMVEMRMPDVRAVSLRHPGSYPAGVREVHFLDTGVPHAVVQVRSAAAADVERLGRALRHNRAFGGPGANVNFVEVRNGGLVVRTYERGVEGETLACGTGIAASAVALVLDGKVRSPVDVTARSGERFRVSLRPGEGGASEIRMSGPAALVFEGRLMVV
ncbi:MAG: diaminopimelate epimerase [Elusimicrobia bacterium]|nr:diaminopimelate epimerase [Elusimicrobiota bacterium]